MKEMSKEEHNKLIKSKMKSFFLTIPIACILVLVFMYVYVKNKKVSFQPQFTHYVYWMDGNGTPRNLYKMQHDEAINIKQDSLCVTYDRMIKSFAGIPVGYEKGFKRCGKVTVEDRNKVCRKN